ncbi:MAG: CRISPR-associated endonuclease Cas2 [Acidobacteria bacterium]|nr:CRISPR-associated endonuclease Cas2 [Acidobacteriota bacterium]
MRNTYLVRHDISDDLRRTRVLKTMKGFGDHLQYSVFECQLNATDLARYFSSTATRSASSSSSSRVSARLRGELPQVSSRVVIRDTTQFTSHSPPPLSRMVPDDRASSSMSHLSKSAAFSSFSLAMFQSSRRFIAVTTRGSTATERLLRVKANSVVCVPVNGEFGTLPGRTVGPGWA